MTYEQRDGNRNNSRNDSRNDFQDDGKMQLFIAKGRNHGMDEGSLAEFIVGETGVNQDSIARIKVLDDFSFFAADSEDAEMILDFFQKKAGDGRPLVSRAKRKKPSGGGDRNDRGGGDRGGFRGERRDFGGNGGNNGRFERSDRNDRGGDRGRRDFRNRDGNS